MELSLKESFTIQEPTHKLVSNWKCNWQFPLSGKKLAMPSTSVSVQGTITGNHVELRIQRDPAADGGERNGKGCS